MLYIYMFLDCVKFAQEQIAQRQNCTKNFARLNILFIFMNVFLFNIFFLLSLLLLTLTLVCSFFSFKYFF